MSRHGEAQTGGSTAELTFKYNDYNSNSNGTRSTTMALPVFQVLFSMLYRELYHANRMTMQVLLLSLLHGQKQVRQSGRT